MIRRRVWIGILLIILGMVGLVLAGGALSSRTHSLVATSAPRVTTPIIIDPGTGLLVSAPAVPPTTRHPSMEGARVRLPELGIDLPIVEGDGQNVPLDVAAHYPSMLWPGEGGRSLLYAHARSGMFGPLFTAKLGQRVEIRTSDGRVLRYVIRQYYPHWSNSDLSILQPADHEQLVLLTCTSWSVGDPKIVAIAEPA